MKIGLENKMMKETKTGGVEHQRYQTASMWMIT